MICTGWFRNSFDFVPPIWNVMIEDFAFYFLQHCNSPFLLVLLDMAGNLFAPRMRESSGRNSGCLRIYLARFVQFFWMHLHHSRHFSNPFRPPHFGAISLDPSPPIKAEPLYEILRVSRISKIIDRRLLTFDAITSFLERKKTKRRLISNTSLAW